MNPLLRRSALGVLLATLAAGEAGAAGTTAAEFLRFSVGRPNGMSDAGGSVVQDATALYWNPAGLADLKSPDVYLSHNGLPETITNNYFGAVMPVSGGPLRGVVAYSLQTLTQGSIQRLDNQGNPTGSFGASDIAHTVGWARRWGDTRGGVSLRQIRQTLDTDSGNAWALGFGAQRDFGDWSAGASVANLGSGLAIGSESFPLPLTVRAGGSLTAVENELFLASDVSLEKGRGTRLHVGAEYRVYPPWENYAAVQHVMVALRTGYTLAERDSDGPSGFAVGGTAELGSFRADINYQPFGQLGNSAQIGLGWKF